METIKKILRIILDWSELITIPIGLLLWYFSPMIMHWSGFDETAGSYDGAVLQKIIFAIVAISIISGFSWIFIKITFPEVYKYLDDTLGHDLSEDTYSQLNLSKWQRSVIVLWLFSLYLALTVFLVSAI